MNKYSDTTLGFSAQFINLPVDTFNKITWRGGDDKLSMLLNSDPGQYLGEWRSMVKTAGTAEKPAITFPVLPWSLVTRRSGRETYQRYSTTEMLFRPICARSRFVKYERDVANQRVKNVGGRYKIVATSANFPGKGSGYDPHKEVFGIVFDETGKECTHGLISLDTWNAYISYNNAAKAFERLTVPEDKLPIFRIGTSGEIINDETFPKVKNFNGGSFTEIEAIGLNSPMLFTITPQFDLIWEAAQGWAKCERWNASAIIEDVPVMPVMPVMPEPSEDFPFGNPTEDEVHF